MINNVIKKIFSKIGLPSVSIMYSILSNWEKIAGSFFFNHSVPYKFFVKKSELYLACDDPNISTEIYFNQDELKKRIKDNLNIPVKVIKSVYDLRKFNHYKNLLSKKKTTLPKIVVSKEKKEKIKKLVSKVKDNDLREALEIFFETSVFLKSLRSKRY